jgi:hypothetical protein
MQNWVCGDEERVFIWLEVYYNEQDGWWFGSSPEHMNIEYD